MCLYLHVVPDALRATADAQPDAIPLVATFVQEAILRRQKPRAEEVAVAPIQILRSKRRD